MSKIDLNQMEKLMSMMLDNDITELEYKMGDLKIELKRGTSQTTVVTAPAPAALPVPVAAAPTAPAAAAASPEAEDANAGLVPIASPMVGTFYASPDPESPVFVSVGSQVAKDTTVCLIEAMKVFNEIKAEVDGVIEKINAKNSDAVEYGQALFYVRPT